ncbi:MAG: tyrosine-type recombinase/integrase [Candidatus Nanohalobium sp.]
MGNDKTPEDVDERLQELKNQEYISDHNKDMMEVFLHKLRAEDNTSSGRNYKYMYTFDGIFKKFVDFPIDKPTYERLEVAVSKINHSELSEWTIKDYKGAIRKFLKLKYPHKQERPKEVQKILDSQLLRHKNSKIENDKEKVPLTPEEVLDMVDEAQNPRDRLIPLFMFETGARITELLNIKLGDVELSQQYAQVTVPTLKNNKEPRTLTLTKSIGLLQDWMEKHPRKGQPDAPLLVNLQDKKWSNRVNKEDDLNYKGKQMTSTNTMSILRKLAERADIDKYISNHVMRHSSATYWGKKLGLETMMYWFGWSSPETAKTYLHHDEEQTKKSMLNLAGIDQEENKDPTENKVCPRCEEKQPPTAQYCSQCSMSLDQEAAQRVKKLEEAGEDIARAKINGLTDEEMKELLRD